jgi:hypothetical protein
LFWQASIETASGFTYLGAGRAGLELIVLRYRAMAAIVTHPSIAGKARFFATSSIASYAISVTYIMFL